MDRKFSDTNPHVAAESLGVVKASGLKYKARSFAMPGVEPGCIIEYRWRETRVHTNAQNVRLNFQRDIPVQRVQYLVKPYGYQDFTFNSITLHGTPTSWTKAKNGFYSTSEIKEQANGQT